MNMIHATPPLTPSTTALLEELDSIHADLAHELGRAAPWDGTLRREARVDAVVASTSIEGFSVDGATARALVDGIHPTGEDEDRWAVACYARAMEHVRVMADDPAFRWLDRVVLDLHFDACVFQRAKSPGRWRERAISVTAPPGGHVYSAPDAAEVPKLIDATLDWLSHRTDDEHLLVRAAMAHLHVVSIHPFRDGNGRIARIVQSLVLARGGVLAPEFASIEAYLARHTDEYYRQLQLAQGPSYDPSRDASEWVEFCLTAHRVQGADFQARIRTIAKRWSTLELLVAARRWPDRLVIALQFAATTGLTRAEFAAEAGIANPTATLDLRRLLDAGLLEQRGTGPTTRYVASAALRDLLD